MLYLARTEEPEIQRESLPALSCPSFLEVNRANMCRNGALGPLCLGLRDDDPGMVRHSACCLANLAENRMCLD